MTKKNKKNTNKWTKNRHKLITGIARHIIAPYCKLKYGIKVEKFKEQQKRPYLILFNHQTAFDQFFVGMAFKGPVYYVASEDIFSLGFASSIIRYLVAPIPIKKQTSDVRAIMTCIKVASEGGTIAIAPEGNRTFSGKTEYINPAIVPLCKKLNLPIALYRIEGGFGVHPRWSDVVRKGKMRGYVSKVIYPEEYATMSDSELLDLIKQYLYVNEAALDGEFKHKKRAEYLERAMYVCPKCGLSTFKSKNSVIKCCKCDLKVEYLPTKQLKGVNEQFPFEFVDGWYDYQSNYVISGDFSHHIDKPLYVENTSIYKVALYKSKKLIAKKATVSLYSDKLTLSAKNFSTTLLFDKINTITILGKNKLNVYDGNEIYQIKSDKSFNALKYIHFYHKYKNIAKGEANGKFLGL